MMCVAPAGNAQGRWKEENATTIQIKRMKKLRKKKILFKLRKKTTLDLDDILRQVLPDAPEGIKTLL